MSWLRVNAVSLIVCHVLVASGCATWSNRTKTIVATVGSGIVAGTIAANLAPKDEQPLGHAALWGGSTAAVVGITSLFIFDEQKRSDEFERQIQVLRKELEVYRNPRSSSDMSVDGVPAFPKEIPQGLKGLVDPGRWTYTRLPQNTWRWHGTHAVIRECEKFEFIPPRLRLGVTEPEAKLPQEDSSNEEKPIPVGAKQQGMKSEQGSKENQSSLLREEEGENNENEK